VSTSEAPVNAGGRTPAGWSALLAWTRAALPLALLVGAILVLEHEARHTRPAEILAHLHSIPWRAVSLAVALTVSSYWLLGLYDVLAMHYLRKRISYARQAFTGFIAYALSHNFGFAAFTGAAVRLRMYGPLGVTGLDIATIAAFCSVTTGLGLAILAGTALLIEPARLSAALHLQPVGGKVLGMLLLVMAGMYTVWASCHRGLKWRGWLLRAPGIRIALAQLVLGTLDLIVSAATLWVLLPGEAAIHLPAFIGVYALAVAAGVLSGVPGGLGVFESVLILCMPGVPTAPLLGTLLAYRGIYYLAPLVAATTLLVGREVASQQGRLRRMGTLATSWTRPLVPLLVSAVTFLAGVVLLLSGATPATAARIDLLSRLLPLPLVELSHLAGSTIGLGLVVLSRSLQRRVHAAYHIIFWLLLAGMAASLLKGLDFEEAALLGFVLLVLRLGRSEFYRPASIMAQRFTPAWVLSLVAVVGISTWIGFIAHRHVEYSSRLWWTFAFGGDAPRLLRASLVVATLAAAYLLLNLLRPARPARLLTADPDMQRVKATLGLASATLANAALMGDKRLLFSTDERAFIMYQVMRESWVALGDPVGDPAQAEELLWRYRELADRHGGRLVFYQVGATHLPLYLDLGLAALKIGEEAFVPLADFSLAGAERAALRQAHRRAERLGMAFDIVPAASTAALMPQLREISSRWLKDKATAEKGFSVGAFSEMYLRHFDIALIRSADRPVAFANLWYNGPRTELSIDLMRFDPDAPRGAMDYLFVELMLWGRAQGFRKFDLGMAPLSGLDQHPLAPVWHRVGGFIFRHGEHFYNFAGLRQYKSKYAPVWESRYLVARGGLRLPQTLLDVSTLIAGGTRQVLLK